MLRLTQKNGPRPAAVFAVFWIALFLLYLPAARCGWVSDTLGWLDAVQHQPFNEYINRSRFGVRSFYQTTQLVTWCLYQVFGVYKWAWHLIHLSLHAVNCTLLYALCRRLLQDCGIAQAAEISAAAAALFCTSPYVGEVVVWEASFHYLQGICFILAILNLLHRFLHKPRSGIAIAAGALFGLSAFSLELFYLTPLLTASLLVFYRRILGYDGAVVKRAAWCILLPQLVLFSAHLALVRVVFGTASARLGDALLHMPATYYAVKPPDYLFHLLGGRFLPQAWRSAAHRAFCTYAGAGLFYGGLLAVIAFTIFHYKKRQRRRQLTGLFAAWMLLAVALVTPMWFPERLLILGDRYLYIILPFFFITAAMLIGRLRSHSVQRAVWICVLLLQCAATFYLSNLWQRSQALTDELQRSIPAAADKTVLLLNNPASLIGAPMIGAGGDGELRLMHNLLYTPPIAGDFVDVLACDLASERDGTGIRVRSDCIISVTLLQPGARWWYGPDYARSYSTPDFDVRLINKSTYILTLKGNPQRFRLLYQQAGRWKEADMRPRETAQP